MEKNVFEKYSCLNADKIVEQIRAELKGYSKSSLNGTTINLKLRLRLNDTSNGEYMYLENALEILTNLPKALDRAYEALGFEEFSRDRLFIKNHEGVPITYCVVNSEFMINDAVKNLWRDVQIKEFKEEREELLTQINESTDRLRELNNFIDLI